MSQEHVLYARTRPAGADLSLKKNLFVKLSAGTAIVPTSAGEATEGVLVNAPESGKAASIAQLGTVKVIASAAITAGAYVTTAVGGKAVATTTTGHVVRGRALEAAADDGDLIEIELCLFIHP